MDRLMSQAEGFRSREGRKWVMNDPIYVVLVATTTYLQANDQKRGK